MRRGWPSRSAGCPLPTCRTAFQKERGLGFMPRSVQSALHILAGAHHAARGGTLLWQLAEKPSPISPPVPFPPPNSLRQSRAWRRGCEDPQGGGGPRAPRLLVNNSPPPAWRPRADGPARKGRGQGSALGTRVGSEGHGPSSATLQTVIPACSWRESRLPKHMQPKQRMGTIIGPRLDREATVIEREELCLSDVRAWAKASAWTRGWG